MGELQEQRDFLLASLRDLEAEHAAGDIDDVDYRTLKDDYTARTAAVLRAIDEAAAPRRERPRVARSRSVLVAGGVVLIAVVAGVAVTVSSGRRQAGDQITGTDFESSGAQLDDCVSLETSGGVEAALACYADVIAEQPASVEAFTYRGWLQVREGDADAGTQDLDHAIELAPGAAEPRIFRAVARQRAGDPRSALADLAVFYASDPTDDARSLADQFSPAVVEAALDECVAGDGTDPVEATLSCYADALAVDPENASALAYQGWLFVRGGQTGPGLERLDRALALDPSLVQAYVFRAVAKGQQGDWAGGLADLATFDTLDPAPEFVTVAARVRADLEAQQDPTP